jgi:hypothetical protein
LFISTIDVGPLGYIVGALYPPAACVWHRVTIQRNDGEPVTASASEIAHAGAGVQQAKQHPFSWRTRIGSPWPSIRSPVAAWYITSNPLSGGGPCGCPACSPTRRPNGVRRA